MDEFCWHYCVGIAGLTGTEQWWKDNMHKWHSHYGRTHTGWRLVLQTLWRKGCAHQRPLQGPPAITWCRNGGGPSPAALCLLSLCCWGLCRKLAEHCNCCTMKAASTFGLFIFFSPLLLFLPFSLQIFLWNQNFLLSETDNQSSGSCSARALVLGSRMRTAELFLWGKLCIHLAHLKQNMICNLTFHNELLLLYGFHNGWFHWNRLLVHMVYKTFSMQAPFFLILNSNSC